MRAVLGIGNPGKRYQNTRHNIGITILERLAFKHNLSFAASVSDYFIARGEISGSVFSLIKPTTFVNNSGIAAEDFVSSNDIDLDDFMVVTDDINLNLGDIRIRKSGGDGGHNGLHSIIYHLESEDFPRLRIGIGSDFEEGEMADYVLSRFSEEEKELLNNTVEFSVSILEEFLMNGYQSSLNYFSREIKKIKSISDNNQTKESRG